ncbi:hypothetical protein RN001_006370 [Aquatica leii]|uniref:Fatty acid desaturase domain-containing protein n=1 Tax=Aquatica leii TaxID=1421715 RepID=A0AAN7SBE0_9COLE|nr:hypothetical protein RN001_006370 [Aquatica leii]
MAPNLIGSSALFLAEATSTDNTELSTKSKHQPQTQVVKPIPPSIYPKYKWNVVWRNVIAFLYLHIAGLYGFYLILFVCSWKTTVWTILYAFIAGQGITAGAHRLWAHRSYKAKLPLRIILMICQTAAFQNHIYEWVRDHRVHHKFTDTDADPHNASRGFFFSHIGWLMLKKHKDVMVKGKTVDMSDIEADPVVRFQRFMFDTAIIHPVVFWNENAWISWYAAGIFRYTISLNFTWLVNSAAHIWGTKSYDKSIKPTENVYVAIAAFGEGWHNYHHVFPWDYKAAELGDYSLNPSTMIIDFFAKIGWAYDLKTVSLDMIERRVKRTGDGTRKSKCINTEESVIGDYCQHNEIWGWGDKDMTTEDIEDVKILNKLE